MIEFWHRYSLVDLNGFSVTTGSAVYIKLQPNLYTISNSAKVGTIEHNFWQYQSKYLHTISNNFWQCQGSSLTHNILLCQGIGTRTHNF